MHGRRVRNVQDARGKLAQIFAHFRSAACPCSAPRLHCGEWRSAIAGAALPPFPGGARARLLAAPTRIEHVCQSASYIPTWLEALQHDKRFIFTAAKLATQAAALHLSRHRAGLGGPAHVLTEAPAPKLLCQPTYSTPPGIIGLLHARLWSAGTH